MKVAILGAGGFIGSYLCKKFEKTSHTVLPVYRETVDLLSYRAVDAWLTANKPDVIINCAISGGGKNVNDINYTHVQNDLQIFLNFFNNLQTPRYINLGSGAEFNRLTSIHLAKERDILESRPLDSYSFTKNTISRMVLNRENFYTLRLFGCFDSTEPANRLIKKFSINRRVTIDDRWFDYISASDFFKIVCFYVENEILLKDINCVYTKKQTLSNVLTKFAELRHELCSMNIKSLSNLSYTGDGSRLQSLGIQLDGLEEGLKEYLWEKR